MVANKKKVITTCITIPTPYELQSSNHTNTFRNDETSKQTLKKGRWYILALCKGLIFHEASTVLYHCSWNDLFHSTYMYKVVLDFF